MKMVLHPVTQQPLYFGRRKPIFQVPHLKLANYISISSIASPPAACDYIGGRAAPAMKKIYLNNVLSCCVISMMGHGEAVITANNPDLPVSVYTDTQITSVYSAVGGYVPGNPSTDNGCLLTDALHYWTSTGMPDGHKIAGYVGIDATNPEEVRTAINLFEVTTAGLELPDAWLQTIADGATWGIAGDPDPSNGHCIESSKYGKDGPVFDTWGDEITVTDGAMTKYASKLAMGEFYAVISQDIINRGTKKSPSGFDWEQLVANANALGAVLTLPV
jgi:hypothetical protein